MHDSREMKLKLFVIVNESSIDMIWIMNTQRFMVQKNEFVDRMKLVALARVIN